MTIETKGYVADLILFDQCMQLYFFEYLCQI